MFKQISYFFLLCSFCLWLIPLGRFIDKSQETKTCGGARAVCLCSSNFQTVKASSAGYKITSNAAHNEHRAPGGSAGYEFERVFLRHLAKPMFVGRFIDFSSLYSLVLSFPSEHVPKADSSFTV